MGASFTGSPLFIFTAALVSFDTVEHGARELVFPGSPRVSWENLTDTELERFGRRKIKGPSVKEVTFRAHQQRER